VLSVYAKSLGASLGVVGILGASYGVPQLLFRIPLGIWSDSLGRQKPLVVGGIVIALVGTLWLWFSAAPWSLVFARGLVGVGASVWVLFIVYAVSFYPPNQMAQAVGIMNGVSGAARTATTAAGGVVANFFGDKATFLAGGVLAAVSLGLMLGARENRVPRAKSISMDGFKQVVRHSSLLIVSVMGILILYSQFTSTWGFVPIYAADIGASSLQLGVLAMLASGMAMAGSLAVIPLMNRVGNARTLALGSLLLGLALVSIPLIRTVPLLYVAQMLNGLGYGMASTQLMALSIHGVEPRQRATAMGFYQAAYSIGMLGGPLVSGFLAESLGLDIVFYFAGALSVVVTGLSFLPLLPRRQTTPAQ
jgi:MFS family permease